MAFLLQTLSEAKSGFGSKNCYQFARAKTDIPDRPNSINPPYGADTLPAAILAAGGVEINTATLYNQYNVSTTQYVLVAAMYIPQEFHFMRKGSNDKWLGKWSQVGAFYEVDYKGPLASDASLGAVNAQLLKKQSTGRFNSVGYFVFPV